MKKSIAALLLVLVLYALPGSVTASSVSDRDRILLELIALLQKQIILLQTELEERIESERIVRPIAVEATISRVKIRGVTPESKFYDGSYVGVYKSDGYNLYPKFSDTTNRTDEKIWNQFVDIAGEEYVKDRVSEFRVYESRNPEFDAYVEQFSEGWIVGVNGYDIDVFNRTDQKLLEELLIHEYGHILMDEYPTVFNTFTQRFWSQGSLRYTDRNFVSEYAATDALEDVTESFAYFITEKDVRGGGLAAEKVDFFYDYPLFTDIKDRLDREL